MCLISLLIFFSLGVSKLFYGINSTKPELPEKHGVAPEQVNILIAHMTSQKPYLDPLLTLDSLAAKSHIPARQLSQLINRHFEKNFFEFINGYRIDEAKQLLANKDNEKVTIIDIMAKVGFNSKATFNTFFKKLVGVTPTQFRKEQLKKARN
jgi:AraC-like DNA-binding protein